MPFSSPLPDVVVPDIPLHEHVLAAAAERGDRPALVDGATGRVLLNAMMRTNTT